MCDCIDKTNGILAESDDLNTLLDLPIYLKSPQRVLICTTKRDPKRRVKPIKILARFCPFCGEEYQTMNMES